jgi:imidazolonepropionase
VTQSERQILIRGARVLTLRGGTGPRRGSALGELGVLEDSDVLIENALISTVGHVPADRVAPDARVIAAGGRVLMPAFVDCHTHACWAGSRLDEWEMRLKGASYLDILASGGGIMSTVRAVRATTQARLAALLRKRLDDFLAAGTTTLEIKSGYGLSTFDEMKMLRAIADAAADWHGEVVPTALLGHAIDPTVPDFVDRTIRETLPAVSAEFPGITIDAFCEQSAWSLRDTVRLFERASELGHPVRVHADQFNALGMLPESIRLGAVSVDHLEASTEADLAALASSDTFGVALPICGLHVDSRYAKLRGFLDSGGMAAIATNCNPGSAPSVSMPLAVALAVRFCGLTPAEAIGASTVNAAALLGFTDRGTIEPGQRGDLVLLKHSDERLVAAELGGNPVDAVICNGRITSRIF